MPYEVTLMDDQEWSIGLNADTPRSILDAIDVRTYGYALLVLTPQWFHPDDVDPFDVAHYVGVYLGQTDNRLNMTGRGLEVLLGYDNDGGDMYTGADGTTGLLDLEAQLDARVFPFANGLTKGTVNSDSTTRNMAIKRGTTRRQWLDTICAAYPSNWEWRINPDGTIDVNTAGTLFDNYTTPTVVLTDQGGRDGAVTGLAADLNVDDIDVSEARSAVVVAWNETVGDQGSASNTLPSGWDGYDGTGIVQRTLIDYSPKRPFRERPRKSIRYNAGQYAAWALNNTTQATRLATRHANKTDTYDILVTAEIDEYHPTRFLTAGDRVYVYDLDLGLVDTGTEVYYRGAAIHPDTLRVQRMTCPVQEGMGVYLYQGGGTLLADLTRYFEPEEEPTVIEAGTRAAFTRAKPRPRRFNRKLFLKRQRQTYRLMKYLETQR